MLNMSKKIIYNTFDQNRLGVALEQAINKHLSVELQCLKVLVKRNLPESMFFDRNVIRLTLYPKFEI